MAAGLPADDWLSLSQAAEMLGVHPGTVRNWSDRGVLPAQRTQGGHRRFRRSDVELWMQAQRAQQPADLNLVVQNALRNTRFQIGEGRLENQTWYSKLDAEAREQYRQSGRALLQGMISFLNADPAAIDERQARAEAQALGYEYAARGRRYGLSSLEATHAFLFFRNLLVEAMLNVYEAAAVRSPSVWGELFRGVNVFTDQILVTLLETFEAYQRANL